MICDQQLKLLSTDDSQSFCFFSVLFLFLFCFSSLIRFTVHYVQFLTVKTTGQAFLTNAPEPSAAATVKLLSTEDTQSLCLHLD